MVVLDLLRLVTLTSLIVEGAAQAIDPEYLKGFNKICQKLTSDHSFDNSMLVSSSWTIYYSWNLNLTAECPELTFRYPDEGAINRVYNYMSSHLTSQPTWSEAALEMSMLDRKMLLFNDPSGVPGLFQGVPLFEDREFDWAFKSTRMPMLNTAMKFLEGGKFLISSSCHNGGGSALAVRRKERPKKVEIDAVASAYSLGVRYPICIHGY